MEKRIRAALWTTAVILTLLCIGRLGMLPRDTGAPDRRITSQMHRPAAAQFCV